MMAILNNRIKEKRLESGKTLLDLAKHIGVAEATMQRYESGVIKNIRYETIVKIAKYLDCNPSYLMGWEDDTEEKNAPPRFNDETLAFMKKFDALPEKNQKLVEGMIDTLLESQGNA